MDNTEKIRLYIVCSLVLCDDASFACLEKDHPYILWIRGINEKGNAQKIANLIKTGMERL